MSEKESFWESIKAVPDDKLIYSAAIAGVLDTAGFMSIYKDGLPGTEEIKGLGNLPENAKRVYESITFEDMSQADPNDYLLGYFYSKEGYDIPMHLASVFAIGYGLSRFADSYGKAKGKNYQKYVMPAILGLMLGWEFVEASFGIFGCGFEKDTLGDLLIGGVGGYIGKEYGSREKETLPN
ncbi:MAG: hypothetical protein JW727_03760 [Candidatus Aenigmarchaeota archaeon]|nr:hypothetical protein [Candidatus Aenigmarchaeota archaeon]